MSEIPDDNGWKPIGNGKEASDACLLWDASEHRVYVGHFEDWYEPEWVDEDGNTLRILVTHYMPLPKPPSTPKETPFASLSEETDA